MKSSQVTSQFAAKLLDQLADMKSNSEKMVRESTTQKQDGKTFAEHLKEGVQEVNDKHTMADKMAADLATGKSGNIAETMIAASQAELSFNLMVQVRNKALEAYNEIMRMPV